MPPRRGGLPVLGLACPGLFILRRICLSCSITYARKFVATASCVAQHHARVSERRWAELQPTDAISPLLALAPEPAHGPFYGVRVA